MESKPKSRPLHRDVSFWIVVVTLVGAANLAQLYYGIPWIHAKIRDARPAPRTQVADRPAIQDVFTRVEPDLDRRKKTHAWQIPRFHAAVFESAPEQVVLIPSEFSAPSGGWTVTRNRKHIGIRVGAAQVLQSAFDWHQPARVICNEALPNGEFDFISNRTTGGTEALQAEIRSRWNLAARKELIPTNVLVLRPHHAEAPGRKPSATGNTAVRVSQGIVAITGAEPDFLAQHIENWVNRPVLNQSGLEGNFDFTFPRFQPLRVAGVQVSNPADHFQKILPEQLGLELVETNLPVEMLVITRAY